MTETVWNGYRRIDFTFEGRDAILVFPKSANANKSWLFKTEYFEAFPTLEVEMLKRGWHLAFIKNVTRWCIDEDLDLKFRFAKYLSLEYGLAPRCVPVGMSCGGMFAVKLAAKYPEIISALYLDAPVMNLLSCPCSLGVGKSNFFEEFYAATKISMSELISYREHPIDKMHVLLENDVPIVLVYGDSDDIVPFSENGALLLDYYNKRGGKILAIGKEGCGHHPHGLPDSTEIANFLEKMGK